MKYLKIVVPVAGLCVAIGASAVVHHYHGGMHHGMDAASMSKHIGEAYKKFAAFDVDRNGQLDSNERKNLENALNNGSLTLPSHTPPKDWFPTDQARLDHMVEMYGRIAAYDGNHDGDFDLAEQEALHKAIDSGALGFRAQSTEPKTLSKSLHRL